jgi:hypothetical protein
MPVAIISTHRPLITHNEAAFRGGLLLWPERYGTSQARIAA